jgi:hypothetical protein
LLTNAQIAAGLRISSSGHVSDLIESCDRELRTNQVARAFVDRCLDTLRREKGEPKA